MDNGRAMMYLTLPVKFSSRNRFPVKPQAKDKELKMISLKRKSTGQ
jgi:hypothetical protein